MKRAETDAKELVIWYLGELDIDISHKVNNYEKCIELLKNHDELVQYLYDALLNVVPDDVKFLGKKKATNIIENIVKKEGY